jgi:hypothetical protein
MTIMAIIIIITTIDVTVTITITITIQAAASWLASAVTARGYTPIVSADGSLLDDPKNRFELIVLVNNSGIPSPLVPFVHPAHSWSQLFLKLSRPLPIAFHSLCARVTLTFPLIASWLPSHHTLIIISFAPTRCGV